MIKLHFGISNIDQEFMEAENQGVADNFYAYVCNNFTPNSNIIY